MVVAFVRAVGSLVGGADKTWAAEDRQAVVVDSHAAMADCKAVVSSRAVADSRVVHHQAAIVVT